MKYSKKINRFVLALAAIYSIGCTKLDQKLNNTLTSTEAANTFNAALFLQSAYNDIGGPYSDMGNIFALEEVPSDMCVVPTRGGDWDDNGKWRNLHQHKWTSDNVSTFLDQFNALNKINFDATNVLTFNPSKGQAAEARFIRALSLYQLLDLFGQFPFRNPGDNLLNAPKVYTGDSAVSFIISELNTILPDLENTSNMSKATQDAARFLLMRTYLNKGAFLNRENPTFADADMQQVITIGNTIINSNRYRYNTKYFDVFSSRNSTNTEGIFARPNTSGVIVNNTGIHNRWWPTLHYKQYTPLGDQGGWNGFSTVAEFYNSFGVNSAATQTPNDTLLDTRIGGRFYPGVTDSSGVRPGLLIGQQYDEKGQPRTDRKNPANLLKFDPNIAADLKETGNDLEIKGIRGVKYPPDYSLGVKSYKDAAGNWLMLFRYPEVVLMVAEAKMRAASLDNTGALTMVNALRTARGASTMSSITLVNTANVYDPKTLLAERARELWWEAVRRTDLIRFGVFLKPWAYKTTDDAKYLVFPIPPASLAANPNLKQNKGYN